MRLHILAAGVLSVLAATAVAQGREPYTPPSDDTVLEHVGLPRAPGAVQLREVRAQWLAEPGNYALALAYARVAADVGRQEDDPRYFGYAESALQPWLAHDLPPPEARLLRATLLQARKDFAGATRDLDALVAEGGPEAAQALLARANLRLFTGDPAGAAQDCAALGSHVSGLLRGICVADAQSLHGEAAAGLAALESLRADSAAAALPVRTWLLGSTAAAAERLGRTAQARADYEEARQLLDAAGTRDPGLLAAYADCLLEHHDNAAVVALLGSATRIDSLLLRLTVAESRLGRTGDAGRYTALLDERFREARQRGDNLHLREEAWYRLELAHDPAGAVQLAQQNWSRQREPIDARILLRAAIAAKQPQAAAPALDWMRQTGIEDFYLQPLAAQLAAP